MKSCVGVCDVRTEGSFLAESFYGSEPSKKILVVDDDPVIHLLLQRHLERAGYQVLQVSNGRDAIAVALRELPSVVVMDVMMPEMDGFKAARELKRAQASKAIPIIMVSAHPLYDVSRHESENVGAALYMSKPFSPAQLLAQVQRLISDSPTG